MHRLRISSGLLCVLALIPGVSRANFLFSDFSSSAGLTLNGDAAVVGDRLRLTPAEFFQRGSAGSTAREAVGGGLDRAFRFRITDPAGFFNDPAGQPGGDGFAFVIQASGPTVLAGYGGSSATRRKPSEADPGSHAVWPSNSTRGSTPQPRRPTPTGITSACTRVASWPTTPTDPSPSQRTTAISDLSDGAIHTARISHHSGLPQHPPRRPAGPAAGRPAGPLLHHRARRRPRLGGLHRRDVERLGEPRHPPTGRSPGCRPPSPSPPPSPWAASGLLAFGYACAASGTQLDASGPRPRTMQSLAHPPGQACRTR